MSATKITFDDGRYEVGLGYGAWAVSVESREIIPGEVRKIGGMLMDSFMCERVGLRSYRTTWTPVDDAANTAENMRLWRGRITG